MNILSLATNNFSVKAKIDLFNYLNGKVQKSIIQGHTKLAYHGLQGCHTFISYKLKNIKHTGLLYYFVHWKVYISHLYFIREDMFGAET